MPILHFQKMNGAGNDFVLLDNRDEVLQLMPQWQLAFGEMVSALQVGDRQGLMQLLQKASHWRRQFS